MIDKTADIKRFIQDNFNPGDKESYDHRWSSGFFLSKLFSVFPRDCIDSYELYDILISLSYTPYKLLLEEENGDGKKETVVRFYWLLIDSK